MVPSVMDAEACRTWVRHHVMTALYHSPVWALSGHCIGYVVAHFGYVELKLGMRVVMESSIVSFQ